MTEQTLVVWGSLWTTPLPLLSLAFCLSLSLPPSCKDLKYSPQSQVDFWSLSSANKRSYFSFWDIKMMAFLSLRIFPVLSLQGKLNAGSQRLQRMTPIFTTVQRSLVESQAAPGGIWEVAENSSPKLWRHFSLCVSATHLLDVSGAVKWNEAGDKIVRK